MKRRQTIAEKNAAAVRRMKKNNRRAAELQQAVERGELTALEALRKMTK